MYVAGLAGEDRWSRSTASRKGPTRVMNLDIHHNWALETGGGTSITTTTAALLNVQHESNLAYDCLSRVYIKYRASECLDKNGVVLATKWQTKSQCNKDKRGDGSRFWVWGIPYLNPTSSANNVQEAVAHSLENGFLVLKKPSAETTPMVPGWKIRGKIWDDMSANTWFLHPLNNNDPLDALTENNLNDYLQRYIVDQYGVYGTRSPIEEIDRDLLRGVGRKNEMTGVEEKTGIEGFLTSCSAPIDMEDKGNNGGTGNTGETMTCTGGPFHWRKDPHVVGTVPRTRTTTPSVYDNYLIDPVFGNGGGISIHDSDVGHEQVNVINNVASVGGGMNIRNSQVVSYMDMLAPGKTNSNSNNGNSNTNKDNKDTNVPIKMIVTGNVAYRSYPFGRNILDKDSNMRPPHSGGQGGGISINLYLQRYSKCISETFTDTPSCITKKLTISGNSKLEQVELFSNIAHTMGGSLSIGSSTNVTALTSDTSRALFGGVVGIQDGAHVHLNNMVLQKGDASVFMRGEGMTDDTTCSNEGGYGGLMYIMEGAHIVHRNIQLKEGRASRAGGGITFGKTDLCEIYANKTNVVPKRSLLVGSDSYVEKCRVDVDGKDPFSSNRNGVGLEQLGRINGTYAKSSHVRKSMEDPKDGANGANASVLLIGTMEDDEGANMFWSPEVGGGLYSDGMDYIAKGWKITNCKAKRGGGAYVKMPAKGIFDQVEFIKNAADIKGGGLEMEEGSFVKISRSKFEANTAGQMGGAIAVLAQTSKDSALHVVSTTMTSNQAPSGGAMYISFSPQLTIDIAASTFNNNLATSIGGGAICALGGASCAEQPCEFSIDGSVFKDNRSPFGSGGSLLLDKSDASVTKSSFVGTATTDEKGKDCTNARRNFEFGTLDNDETPDVKCDLRLKNAMQGGAIAVNTMQSILKLDTVLIKGLLASFGGGLYTSKASTCKMNNVTFDSNEAKFGGAFQGVQGSVLELVKGSVVYNYASVDGGGVHMEKSNLVMNTTTLYENVAATNGGGIYVDKRSKLHGAYNKITSNRALDNGGGLYVGQASAIVDYNSQYVSNIAENAGGATFVTDARCAVFTNNPWLFWIRKINCVKPRARRRKGETKLVMVKEAVIPPPPPSTPPKRINYAKFGEPCGSAIETECGDYLGGPHQNITVAMVCIQTDDMELGGYCSLHPCLSSKSRQFVDVTHFQCPQRNKYACVVPVGENNGYCFKMRRRRLGDSISTTTSKASPLTNRLLVQYKKPRRILTTVTKYGSASAKSVAVSQEHSRLYTKCLFSSNIVLSEHSQGGAICVERKGNFEMEGCQVIQNVAKDQGGGLIVRGRGVVDVLNVMFSKNVAKTGGGLGLRDESQCTMLSSLLYQNEALEEGGGLRISGKVAYIADNVGYAENVAGTDGGSVSVNRMESVDSLCMQAEERALDDPRPYNDCQIDLKNTHHRENVATSRGGSVYTAHLLCKYRTLQSTIDGMITDAVLNEKSKVKLNLDKYQAPMAAGGKTSGDDASRGLQIDR